MYELLAARLLPLRTNPTMSHSVLRVGQHLRGALDTYHVTEQFSEFVYLAVAQRSSEKVVLKSIPGHWRLQNERDNLRRLQGGVPTLRPLLDELIKDDKVPPTIVLKHLDEDLSAASKRQRLTRQEIKYVARQVLHALKGLHENGFVHTDVKPSNILLDYNGEHLRFSQVQLADFGGTVLGESKYAKEGTLAGTSVFRAPEIHLELPWGTASDIWSFGVTLINLIWGLNFHIFEPIEPQPDDMYDTMVVVQQHKWFGPFPASYKTFADVDAQQAILGIMSLIPPSKLTPFRFISEREISLADKAFLLKIMKLGPHDRPSARTLLCDEWFEEKSERTVGWYSKEEWADLQAR